MKSLEDIKNEYAVSVGFEDWHQLFISEWSEPLEMEKHMNNICVLAQKECLKLASENVDINSDSFLDDIKEIRIRESITSENNIIK